MYASITLSLRASRLGHGVYGECMCLPSSGTGVVGVRKHGSRLKNKDGFLVMSVKIEAGGQRSFDAGVSQHSGLRESMMSRNRSGQKRALCATPEPSHA